MFDALSLTEIDSQHAELLPARTVLSLFGTMGGGGGSSEANCNISNGLVGINALNNVQALNSVLAGILGASVVEQCS